MCSFFPIVSVALMRDIAFLNMPSLLSLYTSMATRTLLPQNYVLHFKNAAGQKILKIFFPPPLSPCFSSSFVLTPFPTLLVERFFLLQQCILEASGSQLCVKSWTKPISLPLPLSPFLVVCPFYLNIAFRLMIHSSKRLLRLADYTVKSAILFMFKIPD